MKAIRPECPSSELQEAEDDVSTKKGKKMTNETVEKAKADVKKGMAEVGKAAANLRDDVMVGVEKFKDHYEHNADVEKKTDATRILVNDADTGVRSDSENKKADTTVARDMVPFQQDLYDENQMDEKAEADTEKSRNMVESIFGVNAGIVWEALNLNGSRTIDDLVKDTALNPEEIYGALGWLGRENKITLETQGKVRFFSLRS